MENINYIKDNNRSFFTIDRQLRGDNIATMLLHINGNYPHHSLHSELVNQLADLGYKQIICVPIREEQYKNKYSLNRPGVFYASDAILNLTDRVFFLNKVRKLVNYIECNVDITRVNCILAHTVFSDGAVAYSLHQKYGIPYSIVVRDTDINVQVKFRKYLIPLMRKIIKHACHIIFISPSYIPLVEKRLDVRQRENFKQKIFIIPNAVNSFWFSQKPKKKTITQPIRIIFAGEINKRKNVCTTIRLVKKLNERKPNFVFDVVGDGDQMQNCIGLARKLQIEDKVIMHGWRSNKEDLKNLYDEAHIFVMLSFKETFGTTYIEAISQGIPILYTAGQGVDGYFEEGRVGYHCNPKDVDMASEKVFSILDNYDEISINCIVESKKFCWEKVAEKYADVISSMQKKQAGDIR